MTMGETSILTKTVVNNDDHPYLIMFRTKVTITTEDKIGSNFTQSKVCTINVNNKIVILL